MYSIKVILLMFFVTTSVTLSAPVPGVKEELIQRAKDLKTRVDNELKRLKDEHRDHLSLVLKEEGQRLDAAIQKLENSNDQVDLAIIESDIINIEFRVENEVNLLERETSTQDLLLACAQVLRQWTAQEISDLKQYKGSDKELVQRVIVALRSEELNLERIAQQLEQAQTVLEISILEVELRALEIRLYEALKALDFEPYPTFPPDSTPSSQTTASTVPSHPTDRFSTSGDITSTTDQTTVNTTEIKEDLEKRAKELEDYANYEIDKLKLNFSSSQLQCVLDLEKRVEDIAHKLEIITTYELLPLFESELLWLEQRMTVEVEALVEKDKRVEKLLAIAIALRERLEDDIIALMTNKPICNDLNNDHKELIQLSDKLKITNNDKDIDALETELTSIENRVNQRLDTLIKTRGLSSL